MDRCLLAMTGSMTHISRTESLMKCPKYQSYAPSPACDQPFVRRLIKKGQRGSMIYIPHLGKVTEVTQLSRLGDCREWDPSSPPPSNTINITSHMRKLSHGCLALLFALHLTYFVFESCLIRWNFFLLAYFSESLLWRVSVIVSEQIYPVAVSLNVHLEHTVYSVDRRAWMFQL